MQGKKDNKVLKILGNLDALCACVLLACLIVLTFAGVLRRYIMRSPITWMEEIQMILFVWVVFLGGSAAFREGAHIAIEIVVDTLPKKIGGFVERFDVLLQLVILVYMFIQEWNFYFNFVQNGKTTVLLRIPYSYAYVVVPIGGALMIVSMLFGAYRQFIAKKPAGEEAEA